MNKTCLETRQTCVPSVHCNSEKQYMGLSPSFITSWKGKNSNYLSCFQTKYPPLRRLHSGLSLVFFLEYGQIKTKISHAASTTDLYVLQSSIWKDALQTTRMTFFFDISSRWRKKEYSQLPFTIRVKQQNYQ